MKRNKASRFTAFDGFESIYNTNQPPAGGSTAVRDLVTAARFNCLKKKRMSRFRRGTSSGVRSFLPYNSLVSPANIGRLTFLLSKKLQKSDIVRKRIVLPKKLAETHLPALISTEGIFLKMDDMDGIHVWCFKFRFWPNKNSRKYVLEGTGDFAEEHESQLGDYIMLYRDSVRFNYVKQATKAYEVEGYEKNQVKPNLNGESVNAPPNNSGSCGDLEVEQLNPVSVTMNDSRVDDTNFIYDTIYSIESVTSLDFLGGFMTSYPNYELEACFNV